MYRSDRCVQGFVNLLPCGENDGGLVVCKGAHKVSAEYHEAFKNEEQDFRWTVSIGCLTFAQYMS